MSFAIIETGGKQYKVAEGDTLNVEKLPEPAKGKNIIFDKVLLLDDGKSTQVGTPYIEGAKVTAEFVEQGRGKKVTIIKFKNKIRYHKTAGHRQPFTKVKIAGLK